jgi:hypothetical protein
LEFRSRDTKKGVDDVPSLSWVDGRLILVRQAGTHAGAVAGGRLAEKTQSKISLSATGLLEKTIAPS